MTLSSSLNAALSGLSVTAQRAQMVSSNIANADTEGYGVRRLETRSVSINDLGAGVRAVGVVRQEDLLRLDDRRMAQGQAEAQSERSGFFRRLESAIGTPEADGSLGSSLANMEAAFIEASARPESAAHLSSAVRSASDVTVKLNSISDTLSTQREAADLEISKSVARLNESLEKISELNGQIRTSFGSGRDTATLMDARQLLIDEVAVEIPLKQIDRGRGEVALLGTGGIVLVDVGYAELSFDHNSVIEPDMTVQSGALSALHVNGQPVDVMARQAPIGTGRLQALFELRDVLAPKAQSQLDAVAQDLITRFEDPAFDPSVAAGQTGLFTDRGSAYDSAELLGLAGRIEINASVDPEQGGAFEQLRSGVQALAALSTGDGTQLQRFTQGLQAVRSHSGSPLGEALRSASQVASDFLSMVSSERGSAEVREAYRSAQFETLKQDELAQGVNQDEELRRLLQIEQSYAANAKVIEVVGEMLDILQRIG